MKRNENKNFPNFNKSANNAEEESNRISIMHKIIVL